jgi:hypothetical protein
MSSNEPITSSSPQEPDKQEVAQMINYRYFAIQQVVLDREKIVTVLDRRPRALTILLPAPAPEEQLVLRTELSQSAFLDWYLMPAPEAGPKPFLQLGRWIIQRAHLAHLNLERLKLGEVRLTLAFTPMPDASYDPFVFDLAGRTKELFLAWMSTQVEVIAPFVPPDAPFVPPTPHACCRTCECPLMPCYDLEPTGGDESARSAAPRQEVFLLCLVCGTKEGPYRLATPPASTNPSGEP